eukprot:scaffold6052_cov118-Cylindrotheca_fusiformis.AAC.6
MTSYFDPREEFCGVSNCHPPQRSFSWITQNILRLKIAQESIHSTMFQEVGGSDLSQRLDRLPLSGQKDLIRSVLVSIGTDINQYEDDPYGNGDQSMIASSMSDRDKARELFSCGGDIPAYGATGSFSMFALACITGNTAEVERMIQQATGDSSQQPHSRSPELMKLLETRETSLRLSPLLLVVSAGKNVPQSNQRNVAKLLLKAGASPDCKDVLGKTVVHYGAGSMATAMTLDVVDMCIVAAKSSYLCGQDVELFGLNKEEMNGKRGVAGGFNPDAGRRAVYIPSLDKELWAKPSNIRCVDEELERQNKDKPMLADVQDRLGSVSLHEVVMSDRADVAELLLHKHKTSIHTKDLDDISPLKMTMEGGLLMRSRVCKMITDLTRREATKKKREAKKGGSNFCANCDKDLGVNGGSTCSLCKVTFYCGKECQVAHWKNGHKAECKELVAAKEGIRLQKPNTDLHEATYSFATGRTNSRGAYRKPRGVQFDEKFVVKVQGASDFVPLLIYDETRTCEFSVTPEARGFQEILKAVRAEPAWQGKKTFMKASFDSKGRCTIYPATAGVKNKYSW